MTFNNHRGIQQFAVFALDTTFEREVEKAQEHYL